VRYDVGGYGGYQAIKVEEHDGQRIYVGASESRKDGQAAGILTGTTSCGRASTRPKIALFCLSPPKAGLYARFQFSNACISNHSSFSGSNRLPIKTVFNFHEGVTAIVGP